MPFYSLISGEAEELEVAPRLTYGPTDLYLQQNKVKLPELGRG